MEVFKIENLTFTYPNKKEPALKNISLGIKQGEFITLCGKSGCGKTTLLRQLKPSITPFGTQKGEIFFEGAPIKSIDLYTQSQKIGYVLQSPENQIVTDTVWHELSFGLESLGLSASEIRARVAEVASFFGIESWFHKTVTNLSGGQKQLLNLASVMVMQPSVLILDEPTSQLDPIAAQVFLETISKINREIGTTVILSEHRLESALPMSDRVVVMDEGEIITVGEPCMIGKTLKKLNHDMFVALPTPIRIFADVHNNLKCPITVRDGREWLNELSKTREIDSSKIPHEKEEKYTGNPIIDVRDVWFRYEKNLPDIVKGMSVQIYKSEIYAIVGGNATGKTTSISIISGLYTPYRGEVLIKGRKISDITEKYNGLIGVLPQDPKTLFVKKTVLSDLYEMLKGRKISKGEQEKRVHEVCETCKLYEFLSQHPYDLSDGQRQRVALAKVLLLKPEILILDEPTKGIDAHFKGQLADILKSLQNEGVTIIMVSHDIEFCAKYASRCAMFFDGNIISYDTPRRFFTGKNFYTTAANRMARDKLPTALLAEDVILACGGFEKKESKYV